MNGHLEQRSCHQCPLARQPVAVTRSLKAVAQPWYAALNKNFRPALSSPQPAKAKRAGPACHLELKETASAIQTLRAPYIPVAMRAQNFVSPRDQSFAPHVQLNTPLIADRRLRLLGLRPPLHLLRDAYLI